MSIQSLNSVIPHLVARTSGTEVTDRSVDIPSAIRTDEAGGVKNATESQVSSDAESRPEQRLADVVNDVNEFIKPINNSLQFSIDDESGTTVVKVIDRETEEVIKQIPSEEMLALAKAIGQLKGLLVKQQA